MHSLFDPASPQARAVASLWWWMAGVGGVIWLGVAALAVYAAVRGRGTRAADDLMHIPAESHRRIEHVVTAGVVITVLILAGFLTYDFSVGRLLAQHPQRALTIDVTGH
jgi:heme/copper-type cytochrome/quinol oxidase subunit 2